jgi:hypothetical protein
MTVINTIQWLLSAVALIHGGHWHLLMEPCIEESKMARVAPSTGGMSRVQQMEEMGSLTTNLID